MAITTTADSGRRTAQGSGRRPVHRPRAATVALGAILLVAFALRVASIRHGLPFAFNPDEDQHFVPRAAAAADGDWNPGYFENPSGLTYLLALVFMAVFPGQDMTQLLVTDPTAVFTVARVTVALLGTLAVGLVSWAGRRFFGTAAGLVAAAVMAVGFLPVYYSHQAVNDVPTLVPVTVALVACLLILERGTWWTYLLAGAAVGVAGGMKYLAAPLALVIVLAVVLRVAAGRERRWRACGLLAAAGAVTIGSLVLTTPYLVLDIGTVHDQLTGQSSQAATEKLGQSGSAWVYYPTSLLWGLGWAPVAFTVLGAVVAARSDRARAALLLTFPVLLYLYLGTQDRFFGRWVLSAYPALTILGGLGVVAAAGWLRERVGPGAVRQRAVLPVLLVVLLGQPLASSVHSDWVLGHTDTRTLAREWIREYVDGSRRIVVEPAVPSELLGTDGAFERYPVPRPYQAYELSLHPTLIDMYRTSGFCWVMVNSHQRDRGLAAGLAGATDYYDRLAEESTVRASFSPYAEGAEPPAFSYDFSFNWYPWSYTRPGPVIEVRELDDCSGATGG